MKRILSLIISVSLCISCSSGGDDTPPPDVTPPAAASLVFPENGEVCAEARDLTGNDGDTGRTYTVTFGWTGDASSGNTVTYTVDLTNEDSGTTENFETIANSSNVVFDIPGIVPEANYSWEVLASKNGTDETATSARQTFMAAGIAVVSFVPNTANPVNPARNSVLNTTSSVTLEWSGSDQNNDIEEYDVFFGDTNPPTDMVTVTSDVTTRKVTTMANTIYYWRVVTRDEVGNESTSAVFQFTVR